MITLRITIEETESGKLAIGFDAEPWPIKGQATELEENATRIFAVYCDRALTRLGQPQIEFTDEAAQEIGKKIFGEGSQ